MRYHIVTIPLCIVLFWCIINFSQNQTFNKYIQLKYLRLISNIIDVHFQNIWKWENRVGNFQKTTTKQRQYQSSIVDVIYCTRCVSGIISIMNAHCQIFQIQILYSKFFFYTNNNIFLLNYIYNIRTLSENI